MQEFIKLLYIAAYALFISLFAVSMSLDAYPLANIWVFFSGMLLLTAINLPPVNTLLKQIGAKTRAILARTTTITDEDVKDLHEHLTLRSQHEDVEVKSAAIAMKNLLDKNQLHSSAAILDYLNNFNSRRHQLTHAVLQVGGLATLATASIMQTNEISANNANPSGTPVPSPYGNFQTTTLTSTGYGVMGLTQLGYMVGLGERLANLKLLNKAVKELEEVKRFQP